MSQTEKGESVGMANCFSMTNLFAPLHGKGDVTSTEDVGNLHFLQKGFPDCGTTVQYIC